MKLTDCIGKRVLNKNTGCIKGEIIYAYFDEFLKNIAYFVVKKDDASFKLPFDKIVAVNDVVVIDEDLPELNDSDLLNLKNSVIGIDVYDENGVFKGKIDDVNVTLSGKVTSIVIGKEFLSPNAIQVFNDVIVLKKQKRRVMPRPEKDYTVTILSKENAENKQTNTAKQTEQEPILLKDVINGIDISPVAADHTPPRVIADYNFLLGRILVHDLVSYTGEIIATKNTPVTTAIVEKARSLGKLVDLTLNSK